MRALDLCAGAGGLSLGLQRAGFDVLGIELDPDAIETHRQHVGPCEVADLRTYHPTEQRDLTAGGVPCQPFSAAGLGLGLDDPRYLVPDFLRIAREAGSRAVLLENVRGLVLKPKAFRAVLDAFEAEWLTTWTVVDAADFGVPQHRDRLFVVGFKDAAARARFRWPQPTHAPPGSLFGAPYRTVREALSLGDAPHRSGPKENARPGQLQGMRLLNVDAPAFTVGGHSFDLLDRPSHTIAASAGRQQPQPSRPGARRVGEMAAAIDALDRPAPCVTATEQKSAMSGSQPMSRRQRASERLSEALSSLDKPAPTIMTRVDSGRDARRPSRRPLSELGAELGSLDRPAPTIPAGHDLPNAKIRDRLGAELEAAGLADRPATTVDTKPTLSRAGRGHRDPQKDGAVRLSVEQCALLQGFPPGWTWTGNKGSQHKQVGNAVPPALAEAMGRAVRIALEGRA